jgi:hypothetical protein
MMPWQRPSDTFSEFTFGFALVNELVSRRPRILSVPVFPSLLAEGRAGGGCDVALDRPGQPLFLQFKLSRQMRGWNAKEFQNPTFKRPCYRMYVRPRGRSQQHELLVELERQHLGNVFYCAPAFHTLGELNARYQARRIVEGTRFVSPSELPLITDDDEHWLSFQRPRGGTTAFFSEEGERVELDDHPIEDRLRKALDRAEQVPLRETMQHLAQWFDERVAFQQEVFQEFEEEVEGGQESAPPLEMTPVEKIAMLSNTVLNSTFCVLQAPPEREER